MHATEFFYVVTSSIFCVERVLLKRIFNIDTNIENSVNLLNVTFNKFSINHSLTFIFKTVYGGGVQF